MSDLISYTSKFDKKTKVYLVDSTFIGYKTLKSKFDTHGLGFAIPEKMSVFIDLDKVASDNLTDHHVTFIESHEVAHINLKHSKSFDKNQEAEADYVGILLCKKLKQKTAMKIGIDNFSTRNGISLLKYSKKHHSNIINNNKIIKLI
jgi:hypothetical protein